MIKYMKIVVCFFLVLISFSCNTTIKKQIHNTVNEQLDVSAKDILGNPEYLAMSYGGYRYSDHTIEPTLAELKEDMKLLAAMGVKIIRTYKVHKPQAENALKAITELKKEDPNFEM